MQKLLRKFLIYSVLTVLILPTWVLTSLLTATTARAAAPGDVIINEISAGQDWVELLNTTNSPVGLGTWKLTQLNNPATTPTEASPVALSGTLPAGGILSFSLANINSAGDSVALYEGTEGPANLRERVTFGDVAAPYNSSSSFNSYISSQSLSNSNSISLIAGNWQISQSPTKNWFNGSSISDLVSTIQSAGIITNLDIATPTAETNLYFEKSGYGKISFLNTINLTDQTILSGLQQIASKLDLSAGHVKLDSTLGQAMSSTGAEITMYGLPHYATQPPISVKDDSGNPIDPLTVVSVTSWDSLNGTLTFSASHFTEFEVDLTAPVLQNPAFVSNLNGGTFSAMAGNLADGYFLETSGTATDNYRIQFSNTTTASETLSNNSPQFGYFPLYLTGLDQTEKTALKNYYDARSTAGLLPEPFLTYLKNAVDGSNPFAYIHQVGSAIKLVDAAKYYLISANDDMTVPGDYPRNSYTVSGDISDPTGNQKTVAFILKVVGTDQTAPTIQLNGSASVTLNLNSIYADQGAVATDDRDGSWDITTTESVDTAIPGQYLLRYNAADQKGNPAVEVTRTVTVLPATQLVAGSSTTLTQTQSEVVVDSGNSSSANITVPAAVTNGSLDLNQVKNSASTALLPGDLNISAETSLGNVLIQIPAGTTVTADQTEWDGKINLPTILANSSVSISPDENKTVTISSVIEIGLADTKITFDKAVRLVFAGQAGKSVGFSRGGVFSAIADLCTKDDQIVIDSELAAGGNCKIDSGNDLVVWTKHFTKFVTYAQDYVPLAAPTISTTTSEHDGGKYITVFWQGIGRAVEKYSVVINGIAYDVLAQSSDLGQNYGKEIKVGDGTFSIYVVASRGSNLVNSEIKTVIVATAPAAVSQPSETVSNDIAAPTLAVVGPSKAKAEAPQPVAEPKVDEQGVIKGEDTAANDEQKNEVNWTPWIVLFVLILLAGAATGGYFYWFAGKEEPEKEDDNKRKPDPVKSSNGNVVVRQRNKSAKKKLKRW